jgi:hypothetical protein
MSSLAAWVSKLRAKRRVRREQLAERTYQRQQDDVHRASGGGAGDDGARGASADAAAGAAGAVNTGGTGAGI